MPSSSPQPSINLSPSPSRTPALSPPPDGGYGWTILAACGVLAFWFVGLSYNWGILQASLVKSDLASVATLSFVGSITAATIAVLALVNARVARKWGVRRVAGLGVGLLGVGQVASGWAVRSVGGLFVTAGVVGGLGTRLVWSLSYVHLLFPLSFGFARSVRMYWKWD